MAADDMQFQYALAELRQETERKQQVRRASYSPWVLALSVSSALGFFFGPLLVALYWFGMGWGPVLAAVIVVPVPIMVSWWAWRAFGVELFRLSHEGQTFQPRQVEQLVSEPEPTPVELVPGWEVDGEIVPRQADPNPAAAVLRDECLRFVRAGMRRGGWSRSKLAEGPGKLMGGDSWDRASHELQRLSYFGGSPLKPARDLGDIIKRLELAQ